MSTIDTSPSELRALADLIYNLPDGFDGWSKTFTTLRAVADEKEHAEAGATVDRMFEDPSANLTTERTGLPVAPQPPEAGEQEACDYRQAAEAVERVRNGDERTIPLAEVEQALQELAAERQALEARPRDGDIRIEQQSGIRYIYLCPGWLPDDDPRLEIGGWN